MAGLTGVGGVPAADRERAIGGTGDVNVSIAPGGVTPSGAITDDAAEAAAAQAVGAARPGASINTQLAVAARGVVHPRVRRPGGGYSAWRRE